MRCCLCLTQPGTMLARDGNLIMLLCEYCNYLLAVEVQREERRAPK
jgi:hypothetical protein